MWFTGRSLRTCRRMGLVCWVRAILGASFSEVKPEKANWIDADGVSFLALV